MKLKYYLRGLGIGILVTTIIMTIASPKKEVSLSDEEIIARAAQLGMVMKEDADDGATGNPLDGNPENKTPVSSDDGDADQETREPGSGNPDQGIGEPGSENPDQGTGEPESPESGADSEMQGADNTPEEGNTSAPDGSYRLVIERGDVCRTVCERLAANNVISDAEAMRTYLFEIGYASSMSTGEYEIPYGLTMEQVADILKSGPIKY